MDPNKVKLGDLIQVREEIPFGPPVGSVGIINLVRMDNVCSKSGIVGLPPEEGGPEYKMEKAICAIFSDRMHRLCFYDRMDVLETI